VLDYVAAHEVAHLVEMNHSAAYWAMVSRLCPGWQQASGPGCTATGRTCTATASGRAAAGIDRAGAAGVPCAMQMTAAPPDPNAAAHERLYRSLRQQVMHGELAPGQALTLRGIGKQFGVSMTPAREAVRRLVAEGALTLSSSGRVATPN
jgi:hypothetical protein